MIQFVRTRVAPAILVLPMLMAPALGQQEGWSYSPLAGEGDRASLGCARGSDSESFACLAVRCEDDFATGVHVHTSRPEGDAGTWQITIDRETRPFPALVDAAPYGARLEGDIAWLVERLQQGAVAYLEPADGSALPRNAIPLAGSLYAINEALAFCAPRVPEALPAPIPPSD